MELRSADDALTATSYAVLGMVALRGPSSVYDVKRAIEHLTGEFWSVAHVQHYRESERLERLGLLTSRQEPDGRRRRVYEVTEAGLVCLRSWLAQPAATFELRDEGLLKLFFAELGDRRSVAALARQQAAQYEARLAALEALADRFGPRRDLAVRLTPMHFGRALYRAAIDFWSSVAARPPAPTASRAGARRDEPSER